MFGKLKQRLLQSNKWYDFLDPYNMKYLYLSKLIRLIVFILLINKLQAQTSSWSLWASGLPGGAFPKMWVAPNHDMFYGLTGTGGTKGLVYKANTLNQTGSFTVMPAIPVPASITNNIQTIVTNSNNEPIVGIFRSEISEPFLFRFDNIQQKWLNVNVDYPPNLGAFSNAVSPNGTIWIGTKWSYIYKSTDNGGSFTRIDESPIVKSLYPCYYPAWHGNPSDGAIYAINVDGNGRVYAGTEGAGVIYSDDEGTTWHPADYNACLESDPTKKDSFSSMEPLSNTGNLGAIGFTKDNNVVFNGTSLWDFNWKSSLAFANMNAETVVPVNGFLDYFITTGLQITKIVTTDNGQLFLHSGSNANVPGEVGIYTSSDGLNWTIFNNGITSTSANNGQAQGSLAVDGNKVYMATTDGKVWMYDASDITDSEDLNTQVQLILFPNPASETINFSNTLPDITIFNVYGQLIERIKSAKSISTSTFLNGIYTLRSGKEVYKFTVQH